MQPRKPHPIRPALAALLLAGTAAAVGAGGAMALTDANPNRGAESASTAPFIARSGAPSSLPDMVQAVGPSVVQIRVKMQPQAQRMAMPFDGGEDGGDEDGGEAQASPDQELRRFYGFGQEQAPQRPAPVGGLGSGFIVDPSGVVLTNNHVVDGATEVVVQLSDGREFKGAVLGRDPKADLAVVRIEGHGPFKAVQWADSDRVRVGESVFAVGSPFGLGNTVTAGIVSARSRDIGEGPYDDFLQVDAAINSGNSGGPLFDAGGRVVGVNTAIYSPSGGNVGIGFAIPSDMARNVAQQIIRTGHVSRGRIGVTLQRLTPDIAAAMGASNAEGALIADVEGDGPAARAGLQRGDVVRRFADQPVKDSRALARMVATAQAGASVPVTVLRNGRPLSLDLRVGGDRAVSPA